MWATLAVTLQMLTTFFFETKLLTGLATRISTCLSNLLLGLEVFTSMLNLFYVASGIELRIPRFLEKHCVL